jgi:hypothetical protein
LRGSTERTRCLLEEIPTPYAIHKS